jgi:cyclase
MIRNLCAVLVVGMLAASGRGDARDMNIRVFAINDYLTAFYDGRPAQAPRQAGARNWADYGALDVGVATYVIHPGDQALVYDSFPYARAPERRQGAGAHDVERQLFTIP